MEETNAQQPAEAQRMGLLPVMELFEKSFGIYKQKVWQMAGLVLFGFVGALLFLPLALIGLFINYEPISHSDFNITIILIGVFLVLIDVLAFVIFALWARVALFCMVKDINLTIKESLNLSWSKIGSFFWISFLVGLATAGGLILLIIPGIIFSIWFVFSLFIYLKEGTKGTGALKRSKQLVAGYWWPIFGRLLVIGIVATLLSWIKFFGPIINIFFVMPYTIVFMYALYEDLKRVKP